VSLIHSSSHAATIDKEEVRSAAASALDQLCLVNEVSVVDVIMPVYAHACACRGAQRDLCTVHVGACNACGCACHAASTPPPPPPCRQVHTAHCVLCVAELAHPLATSGCAR